MMLPPKTLVYMWLVSGYYLAMSWYDLTRDELAEIAAQWIVDGIRTISGGSDIVAAYVTLCLITLVIYHQFSVAVNGP